jgi:hypothetical protein
VKVGFATRRRNLKWTRLHFQARKEDSNDRARRFGIDHSDGVRPGNSRRRAATRGGAIVNTPGGMAAVSSAQASLDDACADLDAAVLCLTEIEGETVMANAGLVALLLRVATARRHLAEVARPTTSSPPASFR